MVKLVKVGNSYNCAINYFEADTQSDKTNFDVSGLQMGDKIHVIEDDKFYILNSSKEWKITSYGGML